MKKIILIKAHPSSQLAHLYEHLYCRHLNELFYNHKLYKYVDYSVGGTTFDHGGLIEIDIELYTRDAMTLADSLQSQKILLDDKSIIMSFRQILAEEERVIENDGLQKIKEALTLLDAQPWQHIDDFGVLDTKSIPQKRNPMHINYSQRLRARKIVTTLSLDKAFANSHRDLIPLFRHIAKLIIFTANDLLTIKQGYYCNEVSFRSNPQKTFLKSSLKVANMSHATVNLERDINQYIATISRLRSANAFERLMTELRTTSYSERFWSAPNAYDSFAETAVYVGSRGWQELANSDNLKLVLKNISIEMKFGSQKSTSKIDTEIK